MDAAATGKRIAALRQQKCWTQKQLAEQLHVTDKAVSKWERGEFPKVKDTTSIPRGLLLNRYSRRAG